MLALQIAAGIVLAVLVLRFWRESIALAVVVALLGGVGLLLFWGTHEGPDVLRIMVGLIWGAIAIQWVIGRVQAKSERAVIVDDGDLRD